MIKKIIKDYLDITELEGRVDSLEKEVERQLRHFGNYKNRTDKELDLMRKQVTDVLETIDNLVKQGEYQRDMHRAKNLIKRLKNNKTRIENAQRQAR
jgi:molecular chaperone GrpE (heat shock protein)